MSKTASGSIDKANNDLVQVVLKRTHRHKGIVHQAGAVLELPKSIVERLTIREVV